VTQISGWSFYRGPKIIVYRDGLVIFQRDTKRWPHEYYVTRLAEKRRDELLGPLRKWTLPGCCRTVEANVSDQDRTFIVAINGRNKVASVYGSIARHRARIPRLLFRLWSFDDRNAKIWEPPTVAVQLYPKEKPVAGQEYLTWPEAWPSPPNVPSPKDGAYDIALPSSALSELRKMYPGVGRAVPVRIGNQVFVVNYRFHVPKERAILRAISAAETGAGCPMCTATGSN
jgi:hypothetical protein